MNVVNFLTAHIEQFGGWSYLVLFVLTFFESLIFIGFFIPGALITAIVVFFELHGSLNVFLATLSIMVGAFLGDVASYYLGTKGTHLFKDEGKILKRAHLERAERFFHRHGAKSVFIGRFYPIRPIIPFVAGLSHMRKRKFLFWSGLSVVLWVVLYFSLGYFFAGALKKVEIWSERASGFLLVGTIVLIVGYGVVKRLRKERSE